MSSKPKIKNIAKRVRALEKAEQGSTSDSNTNLSFTVNNAGSLTLLNAVAEGVTEGARVGSELTQKHIEMRFYINQAAAATQTICRAILLVYKAPGTVVPTVGDILESVFVYSYFETNKVSQFHVLWDKTFLMNSGHGTQEFSIVKKKIPLRYQLERFATDGTTVETNAIYLLMLSNEAVNVPSLGGMVNLQYVI